jgi:hypothetical protein
MGGWIPAGMHRPEGFLKENRVTHLMASQIGKSLYLSMSMRTMILAAVMMAALALTAMAADAGKPKKGKVKHMVAFKFKDSATADDIKKLESSFKALKKKIDVIRSFDMGMNNSPEGLNKGFTHGFLLTFDNEDDRKTYLEHPEHKAFGEMAKAMLADVFVLDFTSEK